LKLEGGTGVDSEQRTFLQDDEFLRVEWNVNSHRTSGLQNCAIHEPEKLANSGKPIYKCVPNLGFQHGRQFQEAIMLHSVKCRVWSSIKQPGAGFFPVAMLSLALAAQPVLAQTFTILYQFSSLPVQRRSRWSRPERIFSC